MFERFSDRGRRVLVLADQEARLLDHVFIGPEHILLALLSEGEGLACQALEAEGLTLELAREEVLRDAERGPEPVRRGAPPFNSAAKRTLELALTEMLQFGDTKVGTEHLLLGLIRHSDNAAVEVMLACRIEPGQVRRRVVELLSAEPARRLQLLREQLQILQGVALAAEHWEDVSAASFSARDREEALRILGGPPLHLSREHSLHVLNMPVDQLTTQERGKLSEEIRQLEASISETRDQPGSKSSPSLTEASARSPLTWRLTRLHNRMR